VQRAKRAAALWGAVVAIGIFLCVLMVFAPFAALVVVFVGSFTAVGVVRTSATARVHLAPVIPLKSTSATRSTRVCRDDLSA
jgi:hypothetical protein